MYSYYYKPYQQMAHPQRQRSQQRMIRPQTPREQTSFPELVGRRPREAATYVSARGYHPVVLTATDRVTRDLRMDRVRILVDPTRQYVIAIPAVG